MGIKKPLTAKRKLLELGVLPIPLGRGRHMGDRWEPEEVMAALDGLRHKAAPKQQRYGKLGLIVGRNLNDLVRELTAPTPRQ